MNHIKRTAAALCALSVCTALTACGGSSSDSAAETGATTVSETTAVTVELNTATVAEEDQETLDEVADRMLRDVELENKEVKWLAHYDINPNTASGTSESINLNLFRTKYGGSVKYYATTWNGRYSDLSTYVLGGEGIDFFPCDTAALPKGIVSGMFQPVDEYIDIDSELWKDVKPAMEIYNFNGKHYELVNSVSAEQVVLYNKQTIEEHGFDDPWELYEEGNWNWDTFTQMLEDFVDEDNEYYGLDGWYNEKALLLSAGVPSVTSENGRLKVNLNDPTIEKAMNWQYELNQKGLVLDLAKFDWSVNPQFMGEGKELFYLIGIWGVTGAPEVWESQIPPEQLGIAPVPSPKGSDPYQSATLDGWVICKGAANPEGVAILAECTRLANTNDEAVAIGDKKLMEDAGWSEELLAHNKEINELAAKYPVVDLATGVSTDVASLTTDGGAEIGLRAAFHGIDWATTRDTISDVVVMLVDEVDQQLESMS
ncbi:MAG: extracellular solute-binding protein [Oscillospiraceae bacterium]|nr:extracellular solute-binding protein [Oscillospiraceae bacterium]